MSIALGFIKGLVGGFTQNIAQEQQARGADDQRVAELENLIFQASLDPKKRVPKEVGNALKQAKQDLKNRGSIDLFGRAGPRLQINMDEISKVVNEVDSDDDIKFLTFGNVKIPVAGKYQEGTGASSFINDARLALDGITNYYVNNPAFLTRDKQYFKQNPVIGNAFQQFLTSQGETFALGSANTLNPKEGDKYIEVPSPFHQHQFIKDNFMLDINPTVKDSKIAYNSAMKKINESKLGESSFERTVLLPFFESEDDKRLVFYPYRFADKTVVPILEKIALLNRFDTIGEYLYEYRKNAQIDLPLATDDQRPDRGAMFPKITFQKFFPRVMHAVELYKRNAWKKPENQTVDDVINIVGYMNSSKNFDQADPAEKIKALAMVQTIDPADLLSQQYAKFQTFDFKDDDISAARNAVFKRYTDVSIDDFQKRFKANEEVILKLANFVENELEEDTSAGGIARGVKKILGGISAPSGQFQQIFNFFTGGKGNISGGDLKKGTTFETLKAIVEKVKSQGNLESDLTRIQENEALMIVLAANMARALDPAGRLSNQDFEVQLTRLGKTGLFGTKAGSAAALQSVVKEFNSEYNKIKMIDTVLINSSRGFNKDQLQLLSANRLFNSFATTAEIQETMSGEGSKVEFDETKTVTSNRLVGPNGLPVTQKIDTNGKEYYFENGKQISKEQVKPVGQTITNTNVQVKPNNQEVKPNDQTQINQKQTLKINMKDITGGNNVDGFTIKGLDYKVKQLPNGEFIRVD